MTDNSYFRIFCSHNAYDHHYNDETQVYLHSACKNCGKLKKIDMGSSHEDAGSETKKESLRAALSDEKRILIRRITCTHEKISHYFDLSTGIHQYSRCDGCKKQMTQ